MSASAAELRSCARGSEAWADSLVSLRALYRAGLAEDVERTPLDPRDERLHRWLRAEFMGIREERLVVLFGDGDGRFITRETLSVGGRHSVSPSPRRIFQRALALDASQLLLAHNHPSGMCEPSAEDIASTRRLVELARPLAIEILDHVIVTPSRIVGILGCTS